MNKEDKKEYMRQYYLNNKCPHNRKNHLVNIVVVLQYANIIE